MDLGSRTDEVSSSELDDSAFLSDSTDKVPNKYRAISSRDGKSSASYTKLAGIKALKTRSLNKNKYSSETGAAAMTLGEFVINSPNSGHELEYLIDMLKQL